MGNFMSMISLWWGGNVERRVLMLGLDNAGKTTVLYKLKLGETVRTIPTIGFNVDTVAYRNVNFTMWDVGGQHQIRTLWKHYYANATALVYVVDCTESHDRLVESRDELQHLLEQYELQGVPLLLFCNKQDLPNAQSPSLLVDFFGLHKLKSRNWHVQSCVAVNGEGLYEGLDWLAREVTRRRSKV